MPMDKPTPETPNKIELDILYSIANKGIVAPKYKEDNIDKPSSINIPAPGQYNNLKTNPMMNMIIKITSITFNIF